MSDTKVLALVLLTVFSAFILQWAYFASVGPDGELKWVPDINGELSKIKLEEPEAPEELEPWEKQYLEAAERVGYEVEKKEESGFWERYFPGIAGAWDWIERTHIFDIATFNIWEGIDADVPRGVRYAFSLIMGIIIYAIPAYLIVKLIRGGG